MSSSEKKKEEEVEVKKDLSFTIPPSTAALVVHLRLEAPKTPTDTNAAPAAAAAAASTAAPSAAAADEKKPAVPTATPLEHALFELRRRGFIVEALTSSEKSDKAAASEHYALLSCSTKLLVRLALLQGFPVQQYENYSSLQRLQLAQAAVDLVLNAQRETHAVDAWTAHDPKLRERLFNTNTHTEADEASSSETTSDAQSAKKSKKRAKARRPLVQIERSLEAIFAYFGPQLGLYFGFLSYYTQTLGIPAVLGVIVTAHQFLGGDVNSQFLPLFIVVLSLWATWFLQSWKSKCFGYCFSWQTLGLEEIEKDKELAKAASKESSSRTLRAMFSLLVTLAIIVFMLRVMLYFVDWNVRAEELYGASWFRYVPLLLYSLFPVVSPLVFEPIAAFLNTFEQHCTQSDAEYYMVLKRFALQFVNRYSALLYATFYRQDMGMLRELLLSLLITGAAINNAQEIALPRVQQWWNKFRNKSVVVVDPSEEQHTNNEKNDNNNSNNKSDGKSDRKEGKSVYENKTEGATRRGSWATLRNAVKVHAVGKNMLNRTRTQGLLDSEEAKALLANELSLSTYEEDEDLLELVLQFGFVTMFAAALPLTPLLALVNNIFEARVDLAKLSTLRRPPLRVRSSIGAWQRCLEVLAVLAIVTNCFLLCVASEDALFQNMVRFLLQSFPFSNSLRSLFGEGGNGSAEGESSSLALRVVAMLLLEHALFAVTLLLGQFVEETPRFAREAQARESLLRGEKERAQKVAMLAAEGVLIDNAIDSTENGGSSSLSQSSSSSSSLLAMYSASRSPYLFGISDPLQLTALFSAPWLLQSLSLSPLIYLPLSLLYFAQKQTEKERHERQLAIEMVSKDCSLAQLIKENLPGFVKDPDVQRVEWLNSILQRVWSKFSLALDKKLTPEVQKTLDTHCPSFLTCLELKKLSLGSTAPRIAGIRVFSAGAASDSDAYTGTNGSALTIDVELQWLARDLQVSLKVGTAPMPLLVELTELSFTTNVRIELLDLIPALPLFKALSVTILKKPELRFALNIGNTVDVMSLGLNPAMSMNSLVQGIVHSALSDLLIYPKKLVIPLVQEENKDQAQRDLERYTRVTVLGELCVTVHSARDLKGTNMTGDSDPYVTISSSAMQKPETTKIKRKTRTAIFEESFYFDVYDLATQMVNFAVLDHNDFTEHVPLGNYSVSLSELVTSVKDQLAQEGRQEEAEEVLENGFSTQPRTFVLRDVEQGSLVVSFAYTPADKKDDDHGHHNNHGHKKKAKKPKIPIRFEDYRRDEVFSGDLAHLSSNAPLVKDSAAASESIAAMVREKRRKEKKALRELQAQQGADAGQALEEEDDLVLSDSDDDDMSEGAERDTSAEKSSSRRKGAAAQAVGAANMVYSVVKTTTSSAVMSTAKVLGVTSSNSNSNINSGNSNNDNNARPPRPTMARAVSMRPLSLRGRLIISHIKVFNLFASSQSSGGDGRASLSPAKVSLADLRPFVSVTIGQTVQETNYLKNNHHPEYKEALSFYFNAEMINFSQTPAQTNPNATPAVVSPSPDARNRNHPECALAGEDPSTAVVYIRVCDRFSRWSFSKIANMQNYRLLAYVSIPLLELMQNIRKNGKIPSALDVRTQQSAQRSLQAEYRLSGEYADSQLSCKYTWIPDSN